MAKATMGPVGTPHRRTYRAEAALTRGYACMQGTAEDQAKAVTGATVACLGIVEESQATVGRAVSIVLFGECIGIAGGTVNPGDWVKNDAAGKLVASAGEDTENIGRAISAAAADGDEFVLFVLPVKKRS